MSVRGPTARALDRWRAGLATVGGVLRLFAGGGRWWLLPLVVLLLVLAIVLVALQSVPFLAPFVYVVF